MSLLFALLTPAVVAIATDGGAPELLDDLSQPSAWTAKGSDDIRASLQFGATDGRREMCLHYDFSGVSGYAIATRKLPIRFPKHYAFDFEVRGTGGTNTFEFKLVDASGENVWWRRIAEFTAPSDWQPMRIKQRHLSLAWGPTPDKTLRQSESIELVVTAGRSGGKGTLCVRPIRLYDETLTQSAPTPRPRITSAPVSAGVMRVMDGRRDSGWLLPQVPVGQSRSVTVDFMQPREFSGLLLHWGKGGNPPAYRVERSDDGAHWTTVGAPANAAGDVHGMWTGETQSRMLRVTVDGPAAGADHLARAVLQEIELLDPARAPHVNDYLQHLARYAPRGSFPRAFQGQQTYWTVVGVSGGREQALFSEDGMLEGARESAALEPFLIDETERVLSWSDSRTTHALPEGYLPLPMVTRTYPELRLNIQSFANPTLTASATVEASGVGDRRPDAARTYLRYELSNTGQRPRRVRLVLALRPLQANPPQQFLNIAGGYTAVNTLEWKERTLRVNGKERFSFTDAPDRVGLGRLQSADQYATLRQLTGALAGGADAASIADASGFAMAAVSYWIELQPGQQRTLHVSAPLFGATTAPSNADASEAARVSSATYWRDTLARAHLRLGPNDGAGDAIAKSIASATAHILINRNGAAIQPGTRSYDRSWIRDGAMTSSALMRMGYTDISAAYADWFTGHLFANGKVPCCVEARGAVPVPEHDSHGQYIHLIAEQYRSTLNRTWLRDKWPHVLAATRYMEALRQSERTPTNRGVRAAFFGLMPPSISHEGYSDKPAYSYWDDFWADRGYHDAAWIARTLQAPESDDIERWRDQFRQDLTQSVAASMRRWGVSYIPGAADRGDFDATSTTVALAPGNLKHTLPKAAINATFERYWNNFTQRRSDPRWDRYTPYEWRTVGAMARLGWEARANDAALWFMSHRRPTAWNQWGEVVASDPRLPIFVGDAPHGWVASDFIRANLDRLAYAESDDGPVRLLAAVSAQWLTGDGIAVRDLRTAGTSLSFTAQAPSPQTLRVNITSEAIPAGGLRVQIPRALALTGKRSLTVQRGAAHWTDEHQRVVQVTALPVSFEVAPRR